MIRCVSTREETHREISPSQKQRNDGAEKIVYSAVLVVQSANTENAKNKIKNILLIKRGLSLHPLLFPFLLQLLDSPNSRVTNYYKTYPNIPL